MMATKDVSRRYPIVNVPNALTVFRILLIPVFIVLYLWGTTATQWWALAVFVVAGLTDQLDGHIARSYDLVTDFGKLADPLADKLLTLTAFVLLSINGPIPYFWVFTVLVAIREIGITVLREVLRRKGVVVAASSGGKIKTVLQMGLIFLMLIPWSTFVFSEVVLGVVFWVLVILAVVTLAQTLISGWQYCSIVWRSSRNGVEEI
ncbi:CDP-diacylglycerol--glycerol-3-phosphate 3-phosphatidyltransferase [Scrofimicrobium canadense]|nr:CDP-diacylglycerol--glycerol-3-phosphate 3-phosphatidyltransferase [Scrofimicrobium canadense]